MDEMISETKNEMNTPEAQNDNNFPDFGLLKVRTFLKNIGFPAEGVNVSITDPETGQTVSQAVTDSEGQIPPVRLPAPPESYAQSNDMPRPFSQYDLQASGEGFDDVNISNVQIYSESTAVQDISVTSLRDDFTIPYPTLWGDFPEKIPESDIKKLPFPSNLTILPEPVIPELVVVHAGTPDDKTAKNYTLPYRDYINNVASSEIYASWEREALKANILAINSFTLNRVYTEWYRSRGYDFTITSSTAYDQAFFYGRNLFQEIIDVTDEVFTMYVSRPGLNQPLLTQYCDGKRVRRDGWLSQWGSNDLARMGYSALEILKYYYGYDIILKEAPKVQGIPISFPGVLQKGSRGENVRTVQSQLNRISQNYPRIPKLAVDGIYGDNTARSVRIFQEIFSLPLTGVVNYPTWYKLSAITNAVSQ